MKIQRNLFKQYPDLTLEQENKLWSMMLDFGVTVDGLNGLYTIPELKERHGEEAWNDAIAMGKFNFQCDVGSIDRYVTEITGNSLFGTETLEQFTDKDYQRIIDRYYFMMSEPGKGK